MQGLLTIFFVLPIAGATLLLIKVLFEYIFNWDIARESNAATNSTGIRLIIASIAVVLGIILYFGFWGITGILYRITRFNKADLAGRKKNGILNKLFVISADHKIPLNPKLDIRNLLNHQNHEDPPGPNAG